MIKYLLSIFCLFLFSCNALSQKFNLGTPLINNYSKEVYKGGTQSWDVLYSKNGFLLFANNNGLVSFDGNDWLVNSLPNKTILRSVAMDEQGRIYVGGQDELGYFAPNPLGKLIYHDLKISLPAEHQKLEDIWEIEVLGNQLFFRSNDKIFSYVNGQFSIFENGSPITFLAKNDDVIIFNDLKKGLYQLKEGIPKRIKGSEQFDGIPIIDIISIAKEHFLILTERYGVFEFKNGLFTEWVTNASEYIKTNRISSGLRLENRFIAIGTLLGGLLVFDDAGQLIYKITKENGLQNNSISTMCADPSNNIWIGSYNGIDQVSLGSALSLFFPDGKLEGAVYDIEKWNGHLFFGTTNGLYYTKYQDYYNPLLATEVKRVPNSAGQVWGLDLIDDELFMAHNDGAFKINKNFIAEKISPTQGAWRFIKTHSDKMLVGNYSGIDLYQKEKGEWQWMKKLEGFRESSRIMVLDKYKNIWITHPYRGVYKMNFDDDFEDVRFQQFGKSEGIATNEGNYVFDIKGAAVISNGTELLTYNDKRSSFENNDFLFKDMERPLQIRRLIQGTHSIWYIDKKGGGEIFLKENGLQQAIEMKAYPEIGNVFVGGFENLFTLDEKHIFLCTDKGVLHFDQSNGRSEEPIEAKIGQLQLLNPKDSILHSGFSPITETIKLEPNENALKINFTSNYFQNPKKVLYSYQLKGIDEHWSDWSANTSKEYTNLDNGDYTFMLKARNPFGQESETISIPLFIKPPWYETIWAKIIYLLLTLAFLLGLVLIPRRKFKNEQALLESEVKKSEEKLEELKNEKLETEIQFKNQELASTTMHLLQKSETLNKIRTHLQKIQTNSKDKETDKELKKLFNLIDNDIQLEDDWKRFSKHFDQVHRNFLQRLKETYPILSPKDLKLSAYLRMNLSTKEIAPLLNISIRGVEIGRYRLRKKLELTKETNLNEFMIHF